MYIILPNEVDGLPEVERKLRPFLLRQMIWNLEEMEVTVSIPVFKFEYGLNLNEILQDVSIDTNNIPSSRALLEIVLLFNVRNRISSSWEFQFKKSKSVH